MSRHHLCAFAAPAALLVALTPSPAARAQQSAVTLSGGILERASDNFNSQTNAPDTSFDLGWSFTVASPVAVTALGFYDDNNTGVDSYGNPAGGTAMAESHPVGLYAEVDGHGVLIAQSVVAPGDAAYDAPSGAAATPAQSDPGGAGDPLFRYDAALSDGLGLPVSVALLSPGTTYVVAAVTGDDEYDELPGSAFAGGTFGNTPPVSYGQDRFVTGDSTTLQDPMDTDGNMPGGFAGPGYFGPNFLFTAAPEPSQFAGLALGALGLAALALRARRRLSR